MSGVSRGVGSFFGWFDAAEGGAPGSLLWSADPHVQLVIAAVLLLAVSAFAFIYAPFAWRLVRLARLRREVSEVLAADESARVQALRGRIDDAFLRSPVAAQWEIFLARWRNSVVTQGGDDHAPVRLGDLLEESPALPTGARKSLMAGLPGLFLAAGTLGALVAIALAIPSASQLSELQSELQLSALASSIEMALRTALWGLILSMGSVLCTRFLEGRYLWYGEQLDLLVNCVYPYSPPAEQRAAPAGTAPARADLSGLRGELAELLDARFAVQAGAMRSLEAQVSELGTASGGADEIRAASRALSAAAREVDGKLDTLRLVSGSLEQAAGRASGDEQARVAANRTLRELGDSLREQVQEIQETLREGGLAAGAPRDSELDRELIQAGLTRVESSLQSRFDPLEQRLQQISAELAISAAPTKVAVSSEAVDSAVAELRELAASLAESINASGPGEENTSAQLGLIEEELGRMGDILRERLDPIDETLSRTIAEQVGPLRSRLDELGTQWVTADERGDELRAAQRQWIEATRSELQTKVDAALERFGSSIEERIDPLDDSLARVSASISERLDPIDERLARIGEQLVALADSGAGGATDGGLEAVAADLRGVADEFGKALEPAHGLISQLDRKTGDFFSAVRDLETFVARTERSVEDLRAGTAGETQGLREATAALSVQISEALERVGDTVGPGHRDAGEAEREATSDHTRSVQRALDRARAAASASGGPSPTEPETRIHSVPKAPTPTTEDVEPIPAERVPARQPAAVSDPDSERPAGLSSLLSSKRSRGSD